MYQSEVCDLMPSIRLTHSNLQCAPKNIRGLIVGLYQLTSAFSFLFLSSDFEAFLVTIGALLAAIVLNATKDRADHSSWRTPIAVQFAWAAVLGGGMVSISIPHAPSTIAHPQILPSLYRCSFQKAPATSS